MKKWIFSLLILLPGALQASQGGGINLTPDPKVLLRSTVTVTGSWTFNSSVTVNGGCVGCGGGGGGSGGSVVAVATGSDSYFMNFDMAQLHSLTTDFAPIESTSMFKSANSLVPFLVRTLDGAATQYAYGKFIVPNNIDLSSNVYFAMNVIPKASSSTGKNVQILFQSTSAYNGDVFNFQISTGMDVCPMSASTSGINSCSWSQSVSNMGWLPGQQVIFKAGRGHDTSKLLGNDLPGSLYGLNLLIQIPLVSPSGSSGTLTQTQWVQWPAAALTASGTDFAIINATTQVSGLLPSAWYRALDAATTVYARTSYYIPENIDMSSTVMVVGVFQSTTSIAGKSIQFLFQSTGTNGGNIGNIVISTGVDGCAVPAVVGQDFVCRFEQTVAGLGWLPSMDTFLQVGRGHDTSKLLSNELSGAVFLKTLALGIPVKVSGIGTSFNGGAGGGGTNLLTTINTWSAPQTYNSSITINGSVGVNGSSIVISGVGAGLSVKQGNVGIGEDAIGDAFGVSYPLHIYGISTNPTGMISPGVSSVGLPARSSPYFGIRATWWSGIANFSNDIYFANLIRANTSSRLGIFPDGITERFTLSSNGKVGINLANPATADPSAALDVKSGTITSQGLNLTASNRSIFDNNTSSITISTQTFFREPVFIDSATVINSSLTITDRFGMRIGTSAIVQSGNGFFGIGTIAPARILEISQGVGSPSVRLTGIASTNLSYEFNQNGVIKGNWGYHNASDMMQITYGPNFSTTFIGINSFGRVGINSLTPRGMLEVAGNTGNIVVVSSNGFPVATVAQSSFAIATSMIQSSGTIFQSTVGIINTSGVNSNSLEVSTGGTVPFVQVAVSSNGYFMNASSTAIHVLSSCGVTPTIRGGGSRFTVTPGAGATGCTITFVPPFPQPPHPIIFPWTGSITNIFSLTSLSNTAMTVSEVGIGIFTVDLGGQN